VLEAGRATQEGHSIERQWNRDVEPFQVPEHPAAGALEPREAALVAVGSMVLLDVVLPAGDRLPERDPDSDRWVHSHVLPGGPG